MTSESIKRAPTGAAQAATNRLNLFEDQRWEEVFNELLKLTSRTQLIIDLMGTDVRPKRIKNAVERRLAEADDKIKRPRGVGQTCFARAFLGKVAERYDAAYLLALHFGISGPGRAGAEESIRLLAVTKRIQIYNRYRHDLYDNPEDARVSFETYLVLLDGIKVGEVIPTNCRECGAIFPHLPSKNTMLSCPVCSMQHLNASEAKKLLAQHLAKRNSCYQLEKKTG